MHLILKVYWCGPCVSCIVSSQMQHLSHSDTSGCKNCIFHPLYVVFISFSASWCQWRCRETLCESCSCADGVRFSSSRPPHSSRRCNHGTQAVFGYVRTGEICVPYTFLTRCLSVFYKVGSSSPDGPGWMYSRYKTHSYACADLVGCDPRGETVFVPPELPEETLMEVRSVSTF